MSKHTPGPWISRINESETAFCVFAGELLVSSNSWNEAHPNKFHASKDCAEANSLLNAAGPDLLEALESIRLYANDILSDRADGSEDREWLRHAIIELRDRARAAITKATDHE